MICGNNRVIIVPAIVWLGSLGENDVSAAS